MADIKTWRERVPHLADYPNSRRAAVAMQYAEAEIADLRAALAQRTVTAVQMPERMRWAADNGMESDPTGVWCRADVLRNALIAVDTQLVAILNGADGSVYNKLKAARDDLVRIWLPLAKTPDAAPTAKPTQSARLKEMWTPELLAECEQDSAEVRAVIAAQPTPPDDELPFAGEINAYCNDLSDCVAALDFVGTGKIQSEMRATISRIREAAAALRQPGALPAEAEKFATAIVEAEWCNEGCCPFCYAFGVATMHTHNKDCIVHVARAAVK